MSSESHVKTTHRSRDIFGIHSEVGGGSYKLVATTAEEGHGTGVERAARFGPLLEGDRDVPKENRWFTQEFLEKGWVQGISVALIVSNAIIVGFETDYPEAFNWELVENVFLAGFTVELSLRMYIQTPAVYFKMRGNQDWTWNMFDFIIVAAGLVNVLVNVVAGAAHQWGRNATLFRIIRLLRILRVLRIIRIVRFLKQLYLLAYGFIEGAMAVFWVALLASFMLYICSVILVRAYGRSDGHDLTPGDEFLAEHFGNIPRTMFALFELISAPDLTPYRATMFDNPPLVVFLVVFIILGSFGINGLLVALINESILEKNQARIEAERMERESKRKEMERLCLELFDELDVNKNRVLPRRELMKNTKRITDIFESLGVNFQRNDLNQMFYVLDYSDAGIIERSEFVQGVVELCDQIRPMSIMELHYQVSKCTAKVEYIETKVDHAVKSLDLFDVKLDSILEAFQSHDSAAMRSEYSTLSLPSKDLVHEATTLAAIETASSSSSAYRPNAASSSSTPAAPQAAAAAPASPQPPVAAPRRVGIVGHRMEGGVCVNHRGRSLTLPTAVLRPRFTAPVAPESLGPGGLAQIVDDLASQLSEHMTLLEKVRSRMKQHQEPDPKSPGDDVVLDEEGAAWRDDTELAEPALQPVQEATEEDGVSPLKRMGRSRTMGNLYYSEARSRSPSCLSSGSLAPMPSNSHRGRDGSRRCTVEEQPLYLSEMSSPRFGSESAELRHLGASGVSAKDGAPVSFNAVGNDAWASLWRDTAVVADTPWKVRPLNVRNVAAAAAAAERAATVDVMPVLSFGGGGRAFGGGSHVLRAPPYAMDKGVAAPAQGLAQSESAAAKMVPAHELEALLSLAEGLLRLQRAGSEVTEAAVKQIAKSLRPSPGLQQAE